MKELVQFIAASLVDDPTQVSVSEQRRGSHITLNLRVAQEDMGRVIGKNGRVATSMRQLLRVSAAQEGKKVTLNIVDPE